MDGTLMLITLDKAAIGTGLGAAVPALSLSVGGGIPSVIRVETAERPLLVSMLLGGRLHPDSGRVTADGSDDLDDLRRRSALVETPVVSEPTAGIALGTIVAEELSFAGRPSGRRAVAAVLREHGLLEYARVPIRSLPATDRILLFCELALLRDGIDALIITSPERHGGEPAQWYAALAALAERGVTVVIVTDAATADLLVAVGARDALAREQKELQ